MIHFLDHHPKEDEFFNAVVSGLGRPQKTVAPKYLYDRRGSQLFERICELEEYYPTRAETSILEARASELSSILGPECVLYEFGSGASLKTRILLDALHVPAVYVPIDISRTILIESAEKLAASYPKLRVVPVCADYSTDLDFSDAELPESGARCAFFPGSTIGNFDPHEAYRFLRRARDLVGARGGMIVGVDLVKGRDRLERAYDDDGGVTAEFNLNLLDRMNRELGADFDRERFRHRAYYNEAVRRVEMHLESLCRQEVSVGEYRFLFQRGESIHTESSYKFTREGFRAMAYRAGFREIRSWTDPDDLFAVFYLGVGAARAVEPAAGILRKA